MSDNPKLDHLVALFDTSAIRRILDEAYKLGVADGIPVGEARERNRILQVVSGASQPESAAPTAPVETPVAPVVADAADDQERASRAPRGLTRQVVMMVLEEEPGLITTEVQKRAVALDERVSEKTVYNELNRERGRFYQQSMDRWSLIPVRESASEEGSTVSAH